MTKIAFLFPGQGSQKPGMIQEFFHELTEAEKAGYDAAFPGITAAVDSENKEETNNMAAQLVYLSGLFSAEAALEAGIRPDYLAGFSLGEITALSFAGAFSREDGNRLLADRTKAMYEASETIDGAMAAVNGLATEVVEEILAGIPSVYPVNYNSPKQTVISGRRDAVETAAARLKVNGAKVMLLNVKGAFHTELMEDASRTLKKSLQNTPVASLAWPVLSNIDGEVYPKEAGQIKDRIIRQVVNPVRFSDMVEHLYGSGVRIFIETGFGRTLQGLVGRILTGNDILTIGISDRKSLDLALEKIKGFEHVER